MNIPDTTIIMPTVPAGTIFHAAYLDLAQSSQALLLSAGRSDVELFFAVEPCCRLNLDVSIDLCALSVEDLAL